MWQIRFVGMGRTTARVVNGRMLRVVLELRLKIWSSQLQLDAKSRGGLCASGAPAGGVFSESGWTDGLKIWG